MKSSKIAMIMVAICGLMILIGGIFDLGLLGAIGFISIFLVVLPVFTISFIIEAIVEIKKKN